MASFCVLTVLASLLVSAASYNGQINCAPGRSGIVNLFMWKWADIANECEEFLGPNNFCAVQVSPVNENQVIIMNGQMPWFQRWRPVSYKIDTRGGLEYDLQTMINTCNLAGVRVYMDIVMNHMTDGITNGYGSAGNYYNGPSRDYPGVPYSNLDFHQPRSGANPQGRCPNADSEIHDHNDKEQVRNCRLDGLNDLVTSSEKVRTNIVTYANKLIDKGVAGFRLHAAKYIEPSDIRSVVGALKSLHPGWFGEGSQAFVYTDVADLTSSQTWTSEYSDFSRVTEYRFGVNLGDHVRNNDNKNLAGLRYLWNDLRHQNVSLVFVDNQWTQRGFHVGGFKSVLSFHESKLYQIATAFMLAWPIEVVQIMSSYDWPRQIIGDQDTNEFYGPPTNETGEALPPILDVEVDSDERTCLNGWKCEHRMRSISRMVRFRNTAEGSTVSAWWDNGGNQISFARDGKGFIVINNDPNTTLRQTFNTGLPAGTYCDVISSETLGAQCSGKNITVDSNGNAEFVLSSSDEVPIIAITV